MDFDQYQRDARSTDYIPAHIKDLRKAEYCILGAMDQLGEAAARLKKKHRDQNDYTKIKEELGEKLGYLLWYLTTTASSLNLTLDGIATKNLEFNSKRWPYNSPAQNELDLEFPDTQKLPDAAWVKFSTQPGTPEKIIATSYLGPNFTEPIAFGDPVDDNANDEDGYRFHDVFHLGYYALLGWSPVVRKFWNCKRKSKPDIDRIEDGARARDREEAATTFIYKYAYEHNFFQTATTIDTNVLSLVRNITDDLEVNQRSHQDWETAIITASQVQHELMKNKGGWVFASRSEKRLQFSKSGPEGGVSK